MIRWKITLPNGISFVCRQGTLENTIRELRSQHGTDEFHVDAVSEDAAAYVPELGDREVPDTIPEDWV